MHAARRCALRLSFSPCLDGRARSPVPRRLSRERFRPRLGTITHRQAGQTGGRQATQQVLAVHAGSAFRGSAEQATRGRHGPVHVEAAHRRLFGAIPACLSPPPPACDRCSSSSPLATSTAHRMERHQPGRPIRGPRTPARTCAGRSCWSCVRLFQTLAGARAFQNLAERPVRRWGALHTVGSAASVA